MIDSRNVTWPRIPPLASVVCEQGGQEPTELEEMIESVEGETNASNGEFDELQFDRQKRAGDEEDDDQSTTRENMDFLSSSSSSSPALFWRSNCSSINGQRLYRLRIIIVFLVPSALLAVEL